MSSVLFPCTESDTPLSLSLSTFPLHVVGFDVFQDAVIFHSPQPDFLHMTGEAREYHMKKHIKKCAYFPARSIAMIQPDHGRVILPKGNPDLELMWCFYRDRLGLGEEQVIWFEHNIEESFEKCFMRDSEAVAQLTAYIANTIPADPRRRLLLFADRPEITSWAENLGFTVVLDTTEWKKKYGFKDILHPHPGPDQKSCLEMMGLAQPIAKPRGYLCENREELVMAAKSFRENFPDVTEVLVKPVHGSDGDGILFFSVDDDEAFQNFAFEMGTVVMEEKLNLDRNVDGSEVSVVTHYFGDGLLGPSCDQLLGSATSVTAFNGNIFPSAVSRPLRKQCENTVLAIMAVTKPQGPGGFDFLFQGGVPFLVDVNTGRFNGGMNPKAFHKQYADRSSAYVSFKHVPRCTVTEGWEVLKAEGIEFIPITKATEGSEDPRVGMTGVFPLVHLPGNFGSYVAFAETRDECLKLKNRFLDLNL